MASNISITILHETDGRVYNIYESDIFFPSNKSSNLHMILSVLISIVYCFYLVFDVWYNIHAILQTHSLRTKRIEYLYFDYYQFVQEIAKNLHGYYYCPCPESSIQWIILLTNLHIDIAFRFDQILWSFHCTLNELLLGKLDIIWLRDPNELLSYINSIMIFDKYGLIATMPWCTYKQTGQTII